MKKLIIAAAAIAALGTSMPAAQAYEYHRPIIHGIVVHPHRVCLRWEIFGGRRHCVEWGWRRGWF